MPAAMGMAEGKVADTHIHIRGCHPSVGEEVARRMPVVLASTNPATVQADRSGRLELARWLARLDHPPASRVMLNRIRRRRFGKGIAATPDNLGKLGSLPVNPALLDWLALRFVESGWSIKETHRLITGPGACQDEFQVRPRGDPGRSGKQPALAIQPRKARGRGHPRRPFGRQRPA